MTIRNEAVDPFHYSIHFTVEFMPISQRRSHQDGNSTLELTISMPIVLIVTCTTFQFGYEMLLQQSVTAAATEGARAAAKEVDVNAATAQALAVVNDELRRRGFKVSDSNSNTAMLLDYEGVSEQVPQATRFDIGPQDLPACQNSEVRVTVFVDLRSSPFFHVLRPFSVDPASQRCCASSLAGKE